MAKRGCKGLFAQEGEPIKVEYGTELSCTQFTDGGQFICGKINKKGKLKLVGVFKRIFSSGDIGNNAIIRKSPQDEVHNETEINLRPARKEGFTCIVMGDAANMGLSCIPNPEE